MHYAKRYKDRIRQLEEAVRRYYLAIYEAKTAIGENPGISGISTMGGDEEKVIIQDKATLKQIIRELPLNDYGVR